MSYTILIQLLFSLGSVGTYIGHVVGAMRDKEAGFKPFGPLTPGVFFVGAGIVLAGSIIVWAAVLNIME